jgi:GWxTD domain-containing protein
MLYDIQSPVLYFYSEIYNLSTQPEATYTIQYNILDAKGSTVQSFPSRERPVKAASLVEVGGLNVVQLATGNFNFELRIKDNFSGAEIVKRRPFRFLHEIPVDSTIDQKRQQYLANIYKEYSEKDLKDEFDKLKYIITNEEKSIFKSLQPEGKRTFMVDFWFKRDQMPETIENEHRDEYFHRIKMANTRYGPTGNGWQKDRGRVLIIYGEPDEVEKSLAVSEGRLYEVWQYYYIQSGVNFVFIDKNDNNDLELVHSTAHNEIRNYDWQSWLVGRGR